MILGLDLLVVEIFDFCSEEDFGRPYRSIEPFFTMDQIGEDLRQFTLACPRMRLFLRRRRLLLREYQISLSQRSRMSSSAFTSLD